MRFRRFAFKAAVRNGGEQEWKMIMKLYRTSKKNQRLALLAAAASRSASKIEKYVADVYNSTYKPQLLIRPASLANSCSKKSFGVNV